MSIVGDFISQVTKTVLDEGLRKIGGKRRRRRLTPQQKITKAIEEMISKPAKKQTSRRKTSRARSKTKRRGY